jgi:hypothetical protein
MLRAGLISKENEPGPSASRSSDLACAVEVVLGSAGGGLGEDGLAGQHGGDLGMGRPGRVVAEEVTENGGAQLVQCRERQLHLPLDTGHADDAA